MPQQQYSEIIRRQVEASLLIGENPTVLAEHYNIPKNVVMRWRQQLSIGKPEFAGLNEALERKKVGELLSTYMEEALHTLIYIEKFKRNEEWLKQQSADAVATLSSDSANKLFHLLEAAEQSERHYTSEFEITEF